jgi:hypothetical protein
LATFSNAVDWDPGVLVGEQLDPGPVGPATSFRLVVPFLGRHLPLPYEVIRFVPDREVVLGAASGLLRATDRMVVTGSADGAVVSYEAEVRLRGPLQVLALLLRPGFRGVAERGAAGLIQALSKSPAPAATAPGTPVRPRSLPDTAWIACGEWARLVTHRDEICIPLRAGISMCGR